MITPSFWKNKRVLVTGHTGFKGSWLSLWLQEYGAKLCGISLPPSTTPNLFELAEVSSGMESHFIDIRDFHAINQIIQRFEPEIILHLAAQPLVRYSYRFPVETYQTNVMGTVHILESARLSDAVKTVINVTTDKCYENREWLWGYRENEAMGGHDPYSNSKGCSELITQAYRQSFFQSLKKGLASARAGNVIGGGDWSEDRLVPDMIRSWSQKNPVVIRNPNATRPWQHVMEPISGYLLLAERLHTEPERYAEGWNFGPHLHESAPVITLAETLAKVWPHPPATITVQPDHGPHEAKLLGLDITKARMNLGWSPQLDLHTTLSWTADWYSRFLSGESARTLTLSQIHAFSNLNPL